MTLTHQLRRQLWPLFNRLTDARRFDANHKLLPDKAHTRLGWRKLLRVLLGDHVFQCAAWGLTGHTHRKACLYHLHDRDAEADDGAPERDYYTSCCLAHCRWTIRLNLVTKQPEWVVEPAVPLPYTCPACNMEFTTVEGVKAEWNRLCTLSGKALQEHHDKHFAQHIGHIPLFPADAKGMDTLHLKERAVNTTYKRTCWYQLPPEHVEPMLAAMKSLGLRGGQLRADVDKGTGKRGKAPNHAEKECDVILDNFMIFVNVRYPAPEPDDPNYDFKARRREDCIWAFLSCRNMLS